MRASPAHGAEVLLQVIHVHVGLAELQHGSRVVVNVVDAHLLHDAKSSLRGWRRSQMSGKAGLGG